MAVCRAWWGRSAVGAGGLNHARPAMEPRAGDLPRRAREAGRGAGTVPGGGLLRRSRPADTGASPACGPRSCRRISGDAEWHDDNFRRSTRASRCARRPYKLLQKIGEGGCGVVWMAEQEKPVRRRVALKVIKLGMDTKEVIARFEAERQALAMMDHPNIAKVLDAGATESGRPFFVMELVRGRPDHGVLRREPADTRRAARAVHRGLPGDPARAPEGHHPSRHQAVEHPRHAARRRAGAEGHRLRHREGDAGSA